ncbi:MAG: ABC transporter substrate-binding protein [Dehalococcoidia bacterium]|nr:ABC transporter substrate-binding protein [Dehalococcoidia bacterium]
MRWVAGLMLSALLVSACAPAAAPTTGGAAQSDAPRRAENQVLRIAAQTLPGNPSPQVSAANLPIYWAMYDSLIQFGPGFEVRPSVAERWELQPDGTTWRFFLRRDLKFHNGDGLTAEDVAFTMNIVLRENWAQRALFPSVTEARVVDTYTVDFVSSRRDVSTLNSGANLWIVPSAYYQRVGAAGFVANPIGTGPYQMTSFQSNTQISFRLRQDGPHPFRRPIPTELIFRLIPDTSAVIAGLTTGELDISQAVPLTADQVETLRARGMTISNELSASQHWFIMEPERIARNTPLNDRRVRLAMNYAVNKEVISTTLFRQTARPVGQPTIPSSPAFNESLQPFPFNPAEARRLLAEAGYPNGFRLPVGVDFNPGFTRQEFVLAVQSDLRNVGIEVELIPNESAIFVQKANMTGAVTRGDFFMGSLGDNNGMISQSRGFFCNPNRVAAWGCPPEFDRLMTAAYEEADPARRTALLRQASAAYVQDVPAIFLLATPVFVVTTQNIAGFERPTPLFYNFDSTFRRQ